MAKKKAADARKKYVSRGMDGWYSITVNGWFPVSEFEKLPVEEQVKQRGHCVSPIGLGGLTYQNVYQILNYFELFVAEFFGGRFKEELLSKIAEAQKELSQVREETKNMEYPNKFSVHDDGCPEWRRNEL